MFVLIQIIYVIIYLLSIVIVHIKWEEISFPRFRKQWITDAKMDYWHYNGLLRLR